jgi:hypothetical protein
MGDKNSYMKDVLQISGENKHSSMGSPRRDLVILPSFIFPIQFTYSINYFLFVQLHVKSCRFSTFQGIFVFLQGFNVTYNLHSSVNLFYINLILKNSQNPKDGGKILPSWQVQNEEVLFFLFS